jgi:hypothetical protein
MRTFIALVVTAAMALAVGACSAGIPYAAAPYYHFPSNGDHEGNGS